MHVQPSYPKGPDLAALYALRSSRLDEQKNGPERVTENVRSKWLVMSVIYEYACKIEQALNWQEAGKLMREGSQVLRQRLGIAVDFQSEVAPEVLGARPNLFMANHQGGGLDTLLLPGIMPREYAWVLKNDLLGIPKFGDLLLKCEPVVVNRQRPTLRQNGKEIAEKLKAGRDVFFFFEGTRSPDGNVGSSDLARTVMKAVHHAKPGPFNQLGVMVDMFSAMPEPLEKNPFTSFRTHDPVSVHLFDAQHLRLTDDEQNAYNPETLSGNLRTRLLRCLRQKLALEAEEQGLLQ